MREHSTGDPAAPAAVPERAPTLPKLEVIAPKKVAAPKKKPSIARRGRRDASSSTPRSSPTRIAHVTHWGP